MSTATTDSDCSRRRARTSLPLALLALTLITSGLSVLGLALPSSPAQAANVALAQCNDRNAGPLGATTGITCDVTVVNVINGGVTSSTVTVTRQCSLEPCDAGNVTSTTTSSSDLVTNINQCNRSGNDAAPPLITCTVTVTNNISADTPGAQPVTAATVNQCVGTGTGGGLYGAVGPLVCDPYPATTSNATVTQCNGSVTGGGSTAACTVATASRVSPAIPIRVNQCNGTGNAGGTLLTCRTSITTNITAAVLPTGTGSPTPTTSTSGGTSTATPTSSGTPQQITQVPSGGVPAGAGSTVGLGESGALMLGGGLLLAAMAAGLLGLRATRRN